MKLFLYLVALVALLGGLFLLFKPDSPKPVATSAPDRSALAVPPPAGPSPQPSVASPPPAPPPAPAVFDLVIRRGQLVAGPTVIQVHQGDDVIIHITTDTADELHLHGYDLHAKTRPGEMATLQFKAARTGRFGYELHHGKSELGALEVYPR